MTKRKLNDLSDGKKQIIAGLLNKYDIKSRSFERSTRWNYQNITGVEIEEHLSCGRCQSFFYE